MMIGLGSECNLEIITKYVNNSRFKMFVPFYAYNLSFLKVIYSTLIRDSEDYAIDKIKFFPF